MQLEVRKPKAQTLLLILAILVVGSVGLQALAQVHVPAADASLRLDAASRAAVAGKYAQVLAGHYVFADKGSEMAAAIRAKLTAGSFDGISSPIEFAKTLTADVRAVVNDRHLRVEYNPSPVYSGGPVHIRVRRRRSGHSGHREMPPGMIAQTKRDNGGILEVKVLPGNIGYMFIRWMAPQTQPTKAAIAAAFAFLHHTNALIIDLRGNPGGMGYAELFMSYLSEGPRFVTAIAHWREGKSTREQIFKTQDMGAASYGNKKPVFVLTSRLTFSAAEGLAYEIQAFKRGLIVGETTGGGAHPSNQGFGAVPLGYGFSAFVPTGDVINPVTRTNWEGVGVKPNVRVPAGEALGKAWSLAAERLKAATTNPQRRLLFDALSLAKLEGSPTLTPAQLAGRYSMKGGGPVFTIIERGGNLYYQVSNPFRAEVPLVPSGGNRYNLNGVPGHSMTFFMKNGKIEMLPLLPNIFLHTPVLEKQ